MPSPPLPPQAEAFLRRPCPAVMAVAREDGSLHSSATWYDWEDGRLLLNVDESRRRLAWLQPGAPVALTALAPDDWYDHVSLIGHVAELREDEELRDIDRLSLRYVGRPYHNRESRRFTAWVEIDSWHGWREHRTWQEPAAAS